MAEILRKIPPELKENVLLQDIKALDSYCLLNKEIRLQECPKLYANLLREKFNLIADLSAMRTSHDQSQLDLANTQIARLRATFFNELNKIHAQGKDQVQISEDARQEAMDDAIYSNTFDPSWSAVRLMQFHDPSKQEKNINRTVPVWNGIPDDPTEPQITHLDQQIENFHRHITTAMSAAEIDTLLIDLLDTVNHLVGRLGAKPTPASLHQPGTIKLLVKALCKKRSDYDPQFLKACSRLIDLLLMVGAGPTINLIIWHDERSRMLDNTVLDDALQCQMSQAMFLCLLEKVDATSLHRWIKRKFTRHNVFPWRLFDRNLLFALMDEVVSNRSDFNKLMSVEGKEDLDDFFLEYLNWKSHCAPHRQAAIVFLINGTASRFRWHDWIDDWGRFTNPPEIPRDQRARPYPLNTWLANLAATCEQKGMISHEELQQFIVHDRHSWRTGSPTTTHTETASGWKQSVTLPWNT